LGVQRGVPGPEIRLKQGETFRATLRNRLPEGTTIHWHGVPVPNEMDGVPDVTQPPIDSGEDFTYEYNVPEVSGTYFYHSHVGMQLDRAVYGPLVIEPESEPLDYDREFTLMLDDWLDGVKGTPERELERLRSGGSEMSGMGGMYRGGMSGMGGWTVWAAKRSASGRLTSSIPSTS
jgi:multicopper oxidase